jgi:hypothetical protein
MAPRVAALLALGSRARGARVSRQHADGDLRGHGRCDVRRRNHNVRDGNDRAHWQVRREKLVQPVHRPWPDIADPLEAELLVGLEVLHSPGGLRPEVAVGAAIAQVVAEINQRLLDHLDGLAASAHRKPRSILVASLERRLGRVVRSQESRRGQSVAPLGAVRCARQALRALVAARAVRMTLAARQAEPARSVFTDATAPGDKPCHNTVARRALEHCYQLGRWSAGAWM